MSAKKEETVREVGAGEEQEAGGKGDSGNQGQQGDEQQSREQGGQQQGGSSGQGEQSDEPVPPPTAVEWGVRALSVLLLLALVGVVIWGAMRPEEPVYFDFEVKKEQVRTTGEQWVVPIKVQNRGSHSIRDLTITAQLLDDQENVVDEAELVFPLLGYGESVSLDVWFGEDPRAYELFFDIGSYKFP